MRGLSISLFLLVLCLSGCAGLEYQPRNEYEPNGYSEQILENGNYVVTYETHIKEGTSEKLEIFAMKRAAEITVNGGRGYFKVVDKRYEEYEDTVEFPEYTITNTYRPGSSSPFTTTGSEQTYETYVPAHSRKFDIKKVSIQIEFANDSGEGVMRVEDYIALPKVDSKSPSTVF